MHAQHAGASCSDGPACGAGACLRPAVQLHADADDAVLPDVNVRAQEGARRVPKSDPSFSQLPHTRALELLLGDYQIRACAHGGQQVVGGAEAQAAFGGGGAGLREALVQGAPSRQGVLRIDG